jgi:hypothetical protein
MPKRFYGGKRSTKTLNRQHTFRGVQVPNLIDLTQWKPKVINQLQVGRCSGCGPGGMISGHLSQLGFNPKNDFIVSPDDLYNLGRKKEGTLGADDGAEPYDVLTMAQEYGIIPYVDWPISQNLSTLDPTIPAEEAEAIKYPGFTPVQIDVSNPNTALANILDAMAPDTDNPMGKFINFGFAWFSIWEEYTSGLLPMQTVNDSIAGYHDTFSFKADIVNQKFFNQNSWDTNWGEEGCYELPFAMIPVLVQLGMEAEYVTFSGAPTPPPPASLTITTNSLPLGIVGTLYSQTFTATGGVTPYLWAISSGTKPTGLALDSTGIFSGVPLLAGAYTFTVVVADSANTNVSQVLSMTVNPAPIPPPPPPAPSSCNCPLKSLTWINRPKQGGK